MLLAPCRSPDAASGKACRRGSGPGKGAVIGQRQGALFRNRRMLQIREAGGGHRRGAPGVLPT